MNNYVIYTDSACDIAPEILEEWGVRVIPLTFMFQDEDKQYSNYDLSAKDFYGRMREGKVAKTSAINIATFKEEFGKILADGCDLLYIAFSSGLSTTYNSAHLAVEELKEEYPDRKIITVDTLSASAGMGLLVYLTVQKKNEGASIEQAAQFAYNNRLNLCHWFTVDDLVYLKRGGRVSPTVAFVGGLLGIKPIMHMDNDGKLINMFKARGRKAAIQAIADKYGELSITPNKGTVFISHGDCIDDAKALADIVKKTYGVEVKIFADIGPVIGAHSGPGTLALFFLGKER
ncbi:MAG: DegV family protein [Acutalibacteraceae bacterium]|nr:DegV family protein [Acutalibacteraceae bacterium]